MAQATAINENGLYYVGNISTHSKDFKVGFTECTDQLCLKLNL